MEQQNLLLVEPTVSPFLIWKFALGHDRDSVAFTFHLSYPLLQHSFFLIPFPSIFAEYLFKMDLINTISWLPSIFFVRAILMMHLI